MPRKRSQKSNRRRARRPFTADTVLSLFKIKGAETLSTERLDAFAAIVNERPSDSFIDFRNALHFHNGVLTDDVVNTIAGHEIPMPNKWKSHGVCDRVADCLKRIGQIADALPYIDIAIRRNKTIRPKSLKKRFKDRVDAIAAKVHHPKGMYASIVHKRSFEEAFA